MRPVTLPSVVAQAVASIALGLIGTAGVAKLIDPDPTSGALAAARLPSGRLLARAIGLLEIAAAITGLALGGGAVVVAAVLYAGFALFTLSGVLEQRPIQSCGCFGRDDTPPSWIHVGYNVIAAISLAWIAVAGMPAIPWDSAGAKPFLYIAFAAVGTYASYLVLSVMPRTLAVVNQ